MRWLPYFILAYLAIGVQTGAGEYLRVHGGKPDLALLALIFIAINAPRDAALMACFLLGLMLDLVTVQPLGLYAFAYSLVGMFTVSTQEVVYREHPLTHVTLAFVGSLLVAAVELVHGWIYGARVAPTTLFAGAVYTAALGPVVLGLLQRVKRAFGFQPPRRRPAMGKF